MNHSTARKIARKKLGLKTNVKNVVLCELIEKEIGFIKGRKTKQIMRLIIDNYATGNYKEGEKYDKLYYIKIVKPFLNKTLSEVAYTSKSAALLKASKMISTKDLMTVITVHRLDSFEEINKNRIISGRYVFDVDTSSPEESKRELALRKLSDSDKKVLGLS